MQIKVGDSDAFICIGGKWELEAISISLFKGEKELRYIDIPRHLLEKIIEGLRQEEIKLKNLDKEYDDYASKKRRYCSKQYRGWRF